MSDTPNQSADALLLAAAEAIRQRAALRDLPEGERSMARAIAAYNALTGANLSELDGWLFMCILKLSRATAGEAHIDDYTDLAGYAALAAECLQRQSFTTALKNGSAAAARAQQMRDDLQKTDFTPRGADTANPQGPAPSDTEFDTAWAKLGGPRTIVINGGGDCYTVRCRRHEARQIARAWCQATFNSPDFTHYDGLFLNLYCGFEPNTEQSLKLSAEIADAILRANAVATDTAA